MGIIPVIALTPPVGEVLNVSKIQMTVLFYILSKIFL